MNCDNYRHSKTHPRTIMEQSVLTGDMSNCVLIVGTGDKETKFKVIKELLQLHSPVLRTQLSLPPSTSSWDTKKDDEQLLLNDEDENDPIFYLRDLDPQTFNGFLHYIYTWEWNPSGEDKDFPSLLSLWSTAQKLQVGHLEQKINDALCQILISALDDDPGSSSGVLEGFCSPRLGLTPKAVFTIYQTAKYLHVKDKALALILKYPLTFFNNVEDYKELEEDDLIEIFSQNNLEIPNELFLFQLARKWAEERCEDMKRVTGQIVTDDERLNQMKLLLENVLPTIRFGLIPEQEFKNEVEPSGLLSSWQLTRTLLKYLRQDCGSNSLLNERPRKYLSPLEKLPPEILYYIFQNFEQSQKQLSTCRLVSSRFREVIENYFSLHVQLDGFQLNKIGPILSSDTGIPFKSILLKIHNFDDDMSRIPLNLMEALKFKSALLSLKLEIHNIPNPLVFMQCLESLNNYSGLKLELTLKENWVGPVSAFSPASSVTEENGETAIFFTASPRLPKLTSLTISFEHDLAGVLDIIDASPNLKNLNIHKIDFYEDEEEYFEPEHLAQLASFFGSLCFHGNGHLEIGGFIPSIMIQDERALTKLHQQGCTFKSVTVSKFPTKLLNVFYQTLEQLDFTPTMSVENDDKLPLLPYLKSLSVDSSQKWLLKNFSKFPLLQKLSWVHMGVGMEKLNCKHFLHSLHTLQFTIFSHTDFRVLKLVSQCCPNVKTLKLDGTHFDHDLLDRDFYRWFSGLHRLQLEFQNEYFPEIILIDEMDGGFTQHHLDPHPPSSEGPPFIGTLKHLRSLDMGIHSEARVQEPREIKIWDKLDLKMFTHGIAHLRCLHKITFPPLTSQVAELILGFLAHYMTQVKVVKFQVVSDTVPFEIDWGQGSLCDCMTLCEGECLVRNFMESFTVQLEDISDTIDIH